MKIAILSNGNANYSTKRLVEEAEKRGHKVRVIKYKNCFLSLDEKHPEVYYRGKPLKKFDAIIPRISNNMTRYGCAIVRQFEMQGTWTVSSSIAITRARDKLRAQQILTKAGVDTPKTLVSRNTTDIDDLLERIGLPVIIKLATGTHGNGVVLAETKKAAKSALQAFYLYNEDGTNILLQEYVKESAGTDIRAFVVGLQRVGYLRIVPAGYFDIVIAFIVLKENIVLGAVQLYKACLKHQRVQFRGGDNKIEIVYILH